jgi:hypothetical protein
MAITICCLAEVFAASAGESVNGHTVGQTFRDCKDYCPAMVVIPQGKFTIGSPASEAGRGSDRAMSKSLRGGPTVLVVLPQPTNVCRIRTSVTL